jgi:hypothetical protein
LGLCAITQNETGLEIVQSSPSYTFAQLRKARQTWQTGGSGVCAIAQGEADLGKRGVWCLRNCAGRGRPGKARSLVLAQLRKGEADLGKRGVWCLRNCARQYRPGKPRESDLCAIAQGNACPFYLARAGPLYFCGTIYMRPSPPHPLRTTHFLWQRNASPPLYRVGRRNGPSFQAMKRLKT